MTKKIFMTRRIPTRAEEILRAAGYEVTVAGKMESLLEMN